MASQPDNFQKIEQGKVAGVAKAYLEPFVRMNEDRIIKDLVNKHAGALMVEGDTHDAMMKIIGVRLLLQSLENVERKGQQAQAQEVKNG